MLERAKNMDKVFNKKFLFGAVIGILVLSFLSGLTFSILKQRKYLKNASKNICLSLFSRKASVPSKRVFRSSEKSNVSTKKLGQLTITVNALQKGGEISKFLFGSNLAPQMEFEYDVISFAKRIGISCFRFPGIGAIGYHWKTGVADFNSRQSNSPLSNINNVIEFCKRTNTSLIIQVNVESGTAQEAAEWVSYMNTKSGFPVSYWQLGDEVYGDWDKGYMTADKYAQVIKEYAVAMKKADPTIKIGMDWAPERLEEFNNKVVKKAGEHIDFVACHWYPNHTNASHMRKGKIHPSPYEVMANYLQIPRIVNRVNQAINMYSPQRKGKIEVTFMGWDGSWDGPNQDSKPYTRTSVQWSLANAIFHADALGQFAQQGVTVSAQFLFQDINFGLIRGWDKDAGWGGQRWDGETVRPKAMAIQLFSKHFGDVMIESIVNNSPCYDKEFDWWADSYSGQVPYITSYASISDKKNILYLMIINKHGEKSFNVRINLEGVKPKPPTRLFVLSGPDLVSGNEGNPLNVGIKEYVISNISTVILHEVPAHSVNVFEVDYEQ